MADITEEVLRKKIAKILDNAKLNETSTKKVIQKLEENLGVDLKEKKKLVDQLVMEYVNNMESEEEDDASSVEEKGSTEEDKEQDDSNDSDWGKNSKKRKVEEKKKKSPTKPAAKPKKAAGTKPGGRGKGSGYTRAYKLSPALADLMGAEEMPRHEVVKRVWAIIKEKQLYDPNNKQFAICDKPLYKVIGTQRFRIFGMMKYLKTHFLDD